MNSLITTYVNSTIYKNAELETYDVQCTRTDTATGELFNSTQRFYSRKMARGFIKMALATTAVTD